MSTDNHAVWSLYDRLRSARLNSKYYCWRLQRVERLNMFLDFFLLATAPSSAIAGLALWKAEVGQVIWGAIAVPVAIVAVLKPLLGLTKRIKDYESLVVGYRTLEYDLARLRIAVEEKGRYDAAMQADFKRALDRERALVGKNPESRENLRIKRLCQAEVNDELPAASFFVPKDA